MLRMPICNQLIFNKYFHAEPLSYGVLIRLSPGYPPVAGRLHTRYSPVRRSPPKHCCLVMPLDLHVLSMSLAFILSQDQTLRCLFSFFLSLRRSRLFYPSSNKIDGTSIISYITSQIIVISLLQSYYILFHVNNFKDLSLSLFPLRNNYRSQSYSFWSCCYFSKAGAKIWASFLPSKYFHHFFSIFLKLFFNLLIVNRK